MAITTFDPSTYSAVDTFTEIHSKYQDAFDRVPAQVRSVQWVMDQLGSNAKVIDVGCGTGKPVCELFANGELDVTGIDITPKMIEIAKSQVPKAKFEIADSRTWEPSPSGAVYDGVVSYFAFIAAVSQADIRNFFCRTYSWLRPGGLLVFGTIGVEGENLAIKWLGRDVVVSGLSVEQTLEAVKDAGFTIEKHEIEPYLPKGAEVGLCKPEDVWEEEHLFVYARKPD